MTDVFTHLLITDQHTGESLKNFPLAKNEVAVVDRGMCHANAILEKRAEQAHVIARYHYTTMPLSLRFDETPIDIVKWLKEEPKVSYRSLAVKAGSCEREKLEGSLIALLNPKGKPKSLVLVLKKKPAEKVVANRLRKRYF